MSDRRFRLLEALVAEAAISGDIESMLADVDDARDGLWTAERFTPFSMRYRGRSPARQDQADEVAASARRSPARRG